MFYTCLSFCSQGRVCYTPPWADPPGQTPPWADTTLGRHHPGQTLPWADIPPHSACWDMVNKWVVRILLECILVNCIFTWLSYGFAVVMLCDDILYSQDFEKWLFYGISHILFKPPKANEHVGHGFRIAVKCSSFR